MCKHRQLGFNAVQAALLLLLVAIIAVVLFPVFAHHGDRPRQGTCVADERQLGLAILQYYQDYDEFFPTGTQPLAADGKVQHAGVGWAGQVYTYAKDTGLFRCPQDHTPVLNKSQFVISYALNANIASHVSQADMTDPTKTVLLFEVSNAHADVSDYDEGASHGATMFSPAGNGTASFLNGGRQTPGIVYATGGGGKRPYISGPWPPNRHIDANYLLGDGHVKWLKPDQVSTGTNAARPKDAQTGVISGHAAGTANKAYIATFSTE